ncbi:MAG: right-handed parallel beta-helix repeat-containing protein [Paraclostridium sp.]
MLNKDDGIFLPSIEGVVSGKTSQVAGMNEIMNNLIGNDNYLDKRKMSTENTILDLKASSKYKIGDVVEVLGFHTKGDGSHHKRIAKAVDDGSGEQGRNGLWWCIVHSGEVNVSWFGAKGDGVTDDTNSIKKALSTSNIIKFDIDILVTETINVHKNDVILNFKNNSVKTNGFDGVCFDIYGKNIIFENCIFNNGSKNESGLFFTHNCENLTIRNNIIKNTSKQGINDSFSNSVTINNNTVEDCLHGIQLWGSSNINVLGNSVNRVTGGIWSARASNLYVYGNTVSNCSDVGIDFEGGKNNRAHCNYVSSCKNGELAIFKSNIGGGLEEFFEDCHFYNNTVKSTRTYEEPYTAVITDRDFRFGSIAIHSINCVPTLIFHDNYIECEENVKFFSSEDCANVFPNSVEICKNNINCGGNTYICYPNRLNNLKIKNNDITIKNQNADISLFFKVQGILEISENNIWINNSVKTNLFEFDSEDVSPDITVRGNSVINSSHLFNYYVKIWGGTGKINIYNNSFSKTNLSECYRFENDLSKNSVTISDCVDDTYTWVNSECDLLKLNFFSNKKNAEYYISSANGGATRNIFKLEIFNYSFKFTEIQESSDVYNGLSQATKDSLLNKTSTILSSGNGEYNNNQSIVVSRGSYV